ncbi:MAG: UDP-N-acetylmuramoyl-L-alanyl-D-glutamate--2,6-diaminopimelate ligase [Methylophilaceae bacterium]|nr:UDP-N-acetylmuramoyl-L-alanyl-D-glutamate--2,6-diaminopimelate ligase [Methylophilaceae bacterium]
MAIPLEMKLNVLPSTIVTDSRQVVNGSLFMAYPGENGDGRDYILDAIDRGASSVCWEPEGFVWNDEWQVDNIAIANLKQQAGEIASQFYGTPSAKLRLIGVTGTNGKTSITQWLGQCFDYLDQKAAVVGTLGNGLMGQLAPTINTTPDAVLLQNLLADYVARQVRVVAMEVSSHGLSQGRVNGAQIDIAVLTNLSRDHLEYHGTYKNYADAKKRLFLHAGLKHAVLNGDDVFGQALEKELTQAGEVNILTYGIERGDIRASNIRYSNGAVQFLASTPYGASLVDVNLVGRFNVYNLLAVLATLLLSDIAFADAVRALHQVQPLDGRMQPFGGGNLPLVIVDFAHTPDSLRNVLSALRQATAQQLICVFGCGGNRDQGKRALMGQAASQLADRVIVTTDNPRNECASDIISAILEGVSGDSIAVEDRAKAIDIAIASAQAGDIVLVAGKGHETYQEIAGKKHHFSDVEHVEAALKRKVAVNG